MADGGLSPTTFRAHAQARLEGLRTDRYSFWLHWDELAKFLLPRRYRWLVTPNQFNRGSPINRMIRDNTGTLAIRTLASGMLSGISSPTRPWFRLKIDGFDGDTTNPVTLWLETVKSRMLKVFADSNFYNSIALCYLDLAVFGTSVMIIYEDYDDVIRCYNPCAGEYFLANSDRLFIDTMYREMVQTVAQITQWFPEDTWSKQVKLLHLRGGVGLQQEVKLIHAIEPNTDYSFGIPKQFAYREIYFEEGQTSGPLKTSGFFENPAICARWDITGNDAYGRSPGMDALPDVKQLQQETLRKGQAIEKVVNPPMVADMQLKNQPASMLPGGVTYVAGNAQNIGFRAAYQIQPNIADLTADMQDLQERIRLTCHNDLFLMISQLDTVRTATEIDARREEKLVLLGPVLTRLNNELLTPIIKRTFNIMLRAKLLPDPPEEIQGMPIELDFVSMLHEAQAAVQTTGIERLYAFTGGLAAIEPEIMDNLDSDEAVDEYASLLDVSPRIVRSRQALAERRAARAKADEAAAMAEIAPIAADGAKTLSETDVGGGQNALSAMLGGAGLPGVSPI